MLTFITFLCPELIYINNLNNNEIMRPYVSEDELVSFKNLSLGSEQL
jgi:hypothetical protein